MNAFDEALRRELEREIASLDDCQLQISSKRLAARLRAILDRTRPPPRSPLRRDILAFLSIGLVFSCGIGLSYALARAGEPQSAWLWGLFQ